MADLTCFPTQAPINPLRLVSNYREMWGDAHALLVRGTDPLVDAACYVPRIFHAPDTDTENAGVAARDYLEYILTLPPGSFIVGLLHAYTGLANANNATNPPVRSSFRFQLTDVEVRHRFFEKPLPEAWLLNDVPSGNPQGVVSGFPFVQNQTVRLLPAPYPVTPPGQIRVEFWNILATANRDIRLSLLVAVPDEVVLKGRS